MEKYKKLSMEEHSLIQTQLTWGFKPSCITLSHGRSVSTITRELKRNIWVKSTGIAFRGRPPIAGKYRAVLAPNRAQSLSSVPRVARRLQVGSELWKVVINYLKQGYSPEQIAGTLKAVNAEYPSLKVSHETIYSAIYLMPHSELRSEVIGWLRFGHAKRKPRALGEDRRAQIPDMVSIHDRPPEVEERLVPGHWEGDLINAIGNRTAVGKIVERTTLFTVLAKSEKATAESAVAGFSHVLNPIEGQKRLSMTIDQGKKMSRHAQITENNGVKVYFADPHSPWQRGINENTNGLLRQYLPKGEDLSIFSQEDLDRIAWQLNTRPRKSLGFKCPAPLFNPKAFDFRQYYAAIFVLQP